MLACPVHVRYVRLISPWCACVFVCRGVIIGVAWLKWNNDHLAEMWNGPQVHEYSLAHADGTAPTGRSTRTERKATLYTRPKTRTMMGTRSRHLGAKGVERRSQVNTSTCNAATQQGFITCN